MLTSMTGYCSLSEQIRLSAAGQQTAFVELKALNTRFFEVIAKLPSGVSSLELQINKLIQEKLVRGRIYLGLRFDTKVGALETIVPSWPAIDQYLQAASAMKEKYALSGELTLPDLVRLPNVLVAQEHVLSAQDEKAILTIIAKAVDAVAVMRREEGVRLEKDFIKIFTTCTDKIAGIEKEFVVVVEHYKEQIKQIMATQPQTDQPNPHLEELQVTLKKIDIHEEITRFKSHLESIKPILNSPATEKGKHIDFILQELLRETNTMMAKCSAYPISTACIDIKVELEKAREQVQNIV